MANEYTDAALLAVLKKQKDFIISTLCLLFCSSSVFLMTSHFAQPIVHNDIELGAVEVPPIIIIEKPFLVRVIIIQSNMGVGRIAPPI